MVTLIRLQTLMNSRVKTSPCAVLTLTSSYFYGARSERLKADMDFCTNNRLSLTNDITPLVCILNLWLPRFMLISPLYENYIFTLNQKLRM